MKLTLESTSKIVEFTHELDGKRAKLQFALEHARANSAGLTLTPEEVHTLVEHSLATPARIWEGKSESGIACHVFITRVAVANPSYEIIPGQNAWPDTIKCLLCGLMSNNPHDVENKYCGACHVFHDQVHAQFQTELQEQKAPSAAMEVYPLRMVL